VLNALPVVVDHGQCVVVKTSSLLVHSQEDTYSHRSVRQTAREGHTSRSSVHNIIKKDLQTGMNFTFNFVVFFSTVL